MLFSSKNMLYNALHHDAMMDQWTDLISSEQPSMMLTTGKLWKAPSPIGSIQFYKLKVNRSTPTQSKLVNQW